MPECGDCGDTITTEWEKALSGEYQEVWTSVSTGDWVCPRTGDEHRPGDYDPTPCCPDPGCGGRPCTFPGYADNH